MVNNGIKGLVPFEGATKAWTRTDMQRRNESLKGIGIFTRFIVGTTEDATIAGLEVAYRMRPASGRAAQGAGAGGLPVSAQAVVGIPQ